MATSLDFSADLRNLSTIYHIFFQRGRNILPYLWIVFLNRYMDALRSENQTITEIFFKIQNVACPIWAHPGLHYEKHSQQKGSLLSVFHLSDYVRSTLFTLGLSRTRKEGSDTLV